MCVCLCYHVTHGGESVRTPKRGRTARDRIAVAGIYFDVCTVTFLISTPFGSLFDPSSFAVRCRLNRTSNFGVPRRLKNATHI